MLRQLPKLLLVFSLEGTLCKSSIRQTDTIFQHSSSKPVQLRSNLEDFLRFLFIRNKLFFRVGVWDSLTVDQLETLTKAVFSVHEKSILFKYSSPEQDVPIDLQRIWHNYPDFTDANTIFIDHNHTSIVQKENLILFPTFDNDKCLQLLQDYLKFFSYQYQGRKVHTFKEFIIRVPFGNYLKERGKPQGREPDGEASRFW